MQICTFITPLDLPISVSTAPYCFMIAKMSQQVTPSHLTDLMSMTPKPNTDTQVAIIRLRVTLELHILR